MPPFAATPALYRTALDLVTSRAADEYDLFETVLEELDSEFAGTGVLGVMGVAHLTVTKAAICQCCTPGQAISALHLHPTPLVAGVMGDALSALYLAVEDPFAASRIASELGADDRSQPAMVVLADAAVAMVKTVGRFAALPDQTVLTALRQQAEYSLAEGTWTV